ncbi:MAG: E3 binding domain-containing protein, partial [Bacteroidetes bacterium]|nr:E3 binding domain-containing protein [Bacteroidota bacterium]
MSLEIKVPPVGESITEVTLSRWLKKDGDTVAMDEVIAELESDKATFELTAEKAGTLKTVAKEGDTLAIGAVVANISENGAAQVKETVPAPAKESQPQPEVVANAPAPAPAAAVPASNGGDSLQVKVPAVGESITEVTLSRWLKKDGDQVAMDEAIAELESDKATFELTAEKAGTLKTIAKEGDVLAIGAVVCTIEGSGAATASVPKTEAPVQQSAAAAPVTSEKTYASGTPSPAAAKILDERGIATKDVAGTGVGGRITKSDAMTAITADMVSENPQGGRLKSDVGGQKS